MFNRSTVLTVLIKFTLLTDIKIHDPHPPLPENNLTAIIIFAISPFHVLYLIINNEHQYLMNIINFF